jgi:hypothetical protein
MAIIKRWTAASTGEDAEKLESSCIADATLKY